MSLVPVAWGAGVGCSEGQVSVCPASGVVRASELLWEVFATPPPDPAVPFGGLCQRSPLLSVCAIATATQAGKLETQKGHGLSEGHPPGPPAPSPRSRPQLPCLS